MTGKVGPDRVFNEGDQRQNKPLFSRENRVKVLNMLESLRPIAEGHGATFGQLFLAWLLAQPGMTTALAGARTEAQAVENAAAGDILLTGAEITDIRNAVESLDLSR